MAKTLSESLVEAPFAITDGMQRHVRYAELTATSRGHRVVLPTRPPARLVTG
jgi:hypothetical protein